MRFPSGDQAGAWKEAGVASNPCSVTVEESKTGHDKHLGVGDEGQKCRGRIAVGRFQVTNILQPGQVRFDKAALGV